MAAKTLRIVSFVVLMLLACGAQARKLSAEAERTALHHGQARVLVMLADPMSSSRRPVALRERARIAQAAVDRVVMSLPTHGASVKRRFFVVPAVSVVADLATLRMLRDHPDVARIDLDEGGSGAAVPPDEAATLNRVAELDGLGLGGAGMKVAVIDSGVDLMHPDLQSRLLAQQCFCSNTSGTGGCCPNGQATQSGAGAASDDNGHGTNVSGIIVGQGAVAPRGATPDAALVAIKVLDRDNRFCCSSDLVAAMDWLVQHHPDVDAVNLSVGTGALFPGDCDQSTSFTQALSSAVNALVSIGAVVTASAGNEGDSQSMSAPACVRNALSVGATWDFNGGPIDFLGCSESSTAPKQSACFSNRSATTDLYAAGAFVTSTGLNGGRSTYGGTSQAAPMVAACAIALRQAAPVATVGQRMDAMKLSISKVRDPVSGRGYPFLDCLDAVKLLNPDVFEPAAAQCSGAPVPPKLGGTSTSANATPVPPLSRGPLRQVLRPRRPPPGTPPPAPTSRGIQAF